MTNMASVSIAILTTQAYSQLAGELMLAGFKVSEALWADEVLQLLETEHIDVVVIAHDFNDADPELPEVKARLTTLTLLPHVTAKDIIWEVTNLFPGRAAVQ